MGSWNGTCAVSNLHVHSGQRVAVFMLLKNNQTKSFCYGNALYDICPLPFYGKYDDYGAVEDCEGFGLNLVVEALRSRLYKYGLGPNSSHDCEVNKENFSIEKLFEADHEDRLAIEDHNRFDTDAYQLRELESKKAEKGLSDSQAYELDRLANKIKKVDTHRQVTHVIVHGVILDAILEKWYIDEYVGEGGNKGYQNHYIHLYFKDLVDSIPEYVRRISERGAKAAAARAELNIEGKTFTQDEEDALYRLLSGEIFDWNDSCLAGKYMNWFDRDSSMAYGLINVKEYVQRYTKAEDWEGLAAFTKECLTTAWVNSFMAITRKVWTKQCGMGSQNSEEGGYRVLSQAVLDALQADRDKYGYEDEYDEEDDAV